MDGTRSKEKIIRVNVGHVLGLCTLGLGHSQPEMCLHDPLLTALYTSPGFLPSTAHRQSGLHPESHSGLPPKTAFHPSADHQMLGT